MPVERHNFYTLNTHNKPPSSLSTLKIPLISENLHHALIHIEVFLAASTRRLEEGGGRSALNCSFYPSSHFFLHFPFGEVYGESGKG